MQIDDMKPSDYFAHPAISRSQLVDLQRSPLHYWSKHVDPNRIAVPLDTPALRFGTAVHTAVLEPERFAAEYSVGPQVSSKASKTWRDAAAATDCILLTPDEDHAIKSICASLKQHEAANKALFAAPGKNEVTFIGPDKSGLELKCRADRITEGWVIDLKTTQDASTNAFAKSCANFGYHIQAAFYMRVIRNTTGHDPLGFAFVAVEKEPPYAVQVFKASKEMLDFGAKQVDALLEQLAELSVNYKPSTPWPSYSTAAVELDLPAWAMR